MRNSNAKRLEKVQNEQQRYQEEIIKLLEEEIPRHFREGMNIFHDELKRREKEAVEYLHAEAVKRGKEEINQLIQEVFVSANNQTRGSEDQDPEGFRQEMEGRSGYMSIGRGAEKHRNDEKPSKG